MIIPTPPASIKPQRTGDSAVELPPDYTPPTLFETARLAFDGKRAYEHEWPEDIKSVDGLYWEQQLGATPLEQAESASLLHAPSLRHAGFQTSANGITTGDFGAPSSAAALTEFLLHHATVTPRLTVRIRGKTIGPRPKTFDFILDASEEVEAGIVGGRRAVLSVAEQAHRGSQRMKRTVDDLEYSGGAECLPQRCAEHQGIDATGLPGFIHPSSLADINSPGASQPHSPQLFQSLFVDFCAVLTTGLHPAAYYPHHADTSRQHEARAERVQREVEAFCESRSPFKQLVCDKEVFGWDLRRVRAGLETAIRASADVSSLDIAFLCDPSPLIIRPDNLVSRLRGLHCALKIILSALLIYPLLLLYFHFAAPRVQAHYTLRASYPLTSWRLLPPHSTSQSPEELAALLVRRRPTKVARLPVLPQTGASEGEEEWAVLVGTTEGEWIEKCKERIWRELGVGRGALRGARGEK